MLPNESLLWVFRIFATSLGVFISIIIPIGHETHEKIAANSTDTHATDRVTDPKKPDRILEENSNENEGVEFAIPSELISDIATNSVDLPKGEVAASLTQQLGLSPEEAGALKKLLQEAFNEYIARARSSRAEIRDVDGSFYKVPPVVSVEERNAQILSRLRDVFPNDLDKRRIVEQLLAHNPALGFGVYEECFSIESSANRLNGAVKKDRITRSVRGKDGRILITTYMPIDSSPMSMTLQSIFTK